jgi:hypothetical protein
MSMVCVKEEGCMNRKTMSLTLTIVLLALLAAVVITKGQEEQDDRATPAGDQWEYLAVAGPSTTNLTPTGNPRMRKAPSGLFAREAFVLEQHLDRLGAEGWELVAIAGTPTDPNYYFKRRK